MRLVDGDSAVATGGRQCLSRSRPRGGRPGYRGWIIEARSTSLGQAASNHWTTRQADHGTPLVDCWKFPLG